MRGAGAEAVCHRGQPSFVPCRTERDRRAPEASPLLPMSSSSRVISWDRAAPPTPCRSGFRRVVRTLRGHMAGSVLQTLLRVGELQLQADSPVFVFSCR